MLECWKTGLLYIKGIISGMLQNRALVTHQQICARIPLFYWIARFGLPNMISFVCGSQFTTKFWAMIAQLLGVTHMQTMVYHPQANELVEHFLEVSTAGTAHWTKLG